MLKKVTKRVKSNNDVTAVVFDWDGTLLDSYHADASAYEQMFQALGIAWGLKELEKHYSPNWHRVYRAAGIPKRRWEEADQLWRRFYRLQNPALMLAARRVLRALAKRYVLALVTSGNRTRVREQLRKFGLRRFFSACVCAEDVLPRKPHPAPLKLALKRLGVGPQSCVFVGDSPEDIQMAQRAGVRAVGVYGPFPNRKRLKAAKAEALLESLKGLPQLLKSL